MSSVNDTLFGCTPFSRSDSLQTFAVAVYKILAPLRPPVSETAKQLHNATDPPPCLPRGASHFAVRVS
ncbi:hypothetical protein AOLI_G00271370 [Acnodon oligacanthus]